MDGNSTRFRNGMIAKEIGYEIWGRDE